MSPTPWPKTGYLNYLILSYIIFFAFLPTIYIVRMNRLSRRWGRMWVLTPYLYFEDKGITFQKNINKRNVFLKFMGNSLKSRKRLMQIPDAFKTSFKLHTRYNFRPGAAQRIDNWVKFAIQSKVKELDIYGKHYCLARSILSASSITLLRLTCVRLEVPSISTFPL